jgi:DMSO/TMAO reductase YedYZ molybdopterin-dependent catalytic subunit
MVQLFGTNDKLALEIATVIGGILVGGLLGLVARRNMSLALGGFFFAGLAAFLLLQRDPLQGLIESSITVGAAVIAGALMLSWLSGSLIPSTAASPAAEANTATNAPSRATMRMDRRGFLALSAAFVAVGAVLAVVGRFIGSQITQAGSSPGVPIPVPPGTDLDIDGLAPIVVPNSSFYRIDTRLDVPNVDATTWSLRIHGLVNQEVTLTLADLQGMAQMEEFVTIACVSNEVGGRLVGNALWSGVRLTSVLDSAGVQPSATQVVGRSFDGWTAGFPTAHLSGAGKDAIIALNMNREPLPAAHGFPARLIVPGLFGYVSATKWVTEIELTTLEAFDAYWVPLGWAKEGPILTQSRIDLPRGSRVPAGQVQAAGVAWAPTRGISKVEVSLDGGDVWQPAQLSVPLNNYTWVQWQAVLDVAAGPHRLSVRATDGTGETQSAQATPPAPNGARGYHTTNFVAE